MKYRDKYTGQVVDTNNLEELPEVPTQSVFENLDKRRTYPQLWTLEAIDELNTQIKELKEKVEKLTNNNDTNKK